MTKTIGEICSHKGEAELAMLDWLAISLNEADLSEDPSPILLISTSADIDCLQAAILLILR